MNPPVGSVLAVPLTSELAAAMAAQFLGYHPNKWAGDLAIMDYGSTYAGPSTQSQGSSSFADSPAAPPDAIMHSAADGGGASGSPNGGPPGQGGGGAPRPPTAGGGRPGSGSRSGRGRTAFDG